MALRKISQHSMKMFINNMICLSFSTDCFIPNIYNNDFIVFIESRDIIGSHLTDEMLFSFPIIVL